jgi:transcriptional regulator with XRE-family HTH domain
VNIEKFIAQSVRTRRKAMGYTLRQLSKRSGVSASMLSALEGGKKSPTISVLAAIAGALDVPVSRLIERQGSRATIVTRAEALRMVKDRSGVGREHLGALIEGSKIEFLRFTIPARSETGTFVPHRPGSIERALIQKGRVVVHAGEEAHELRAGDAIVYHADQTHKFSNRGSVVAVVYCVIEHGP